MEHQNSPFSNDQIDTLISDGQTQMARRAQNIISRDGILCLTFQASELLSAIDKIVQYPSKYSMEAYKKSLTDPLLVSAINDPYVKVALQLKKSYDLGKLSFFTELTQFHPTRAVTVPNDPIVNKFVQEVKYYLPSLPYIRDDDLRSRSLISGTPSDELYTVGRTKFMNVVDELLFIRFPEQDIMKDIAIYVSAKHTSSAWAHWYELMDPDEDPEASGVTADDQFYNFFGALILSNTLPSDQVELTSIISILIEPIVNQFDGPERETSNESVKDELKQHIPGVSYELIHTTPHESILDSIFLCHAYGGGGIVLIGMGYGHAREEAECRAAAMALYKKSHLDRAILNITAVASERPSVEEEVPEQSAYISDPQHEYDLTYEYEQQTPFGEAPLPIHQYPNLSMPSPVISGITSSTLVFTHPGTLINQEYKRQGEEELNSVPLAPNVSDDMVDKSSKQRLNDLLLELRWSPAQWKTSKLSNSDVQVMCTIENVQIARCISTNKKKAGHLCAQYILNDWKNLLWNLPPR